MLYLSALSPRGAEESQSGYIGQYTSLRSMAMGQNKSLRDRSFSEYFSFYPTCLVLGILFFFSPTARSPPTSKRSQDRLQLGHRCLAGQRVVFELGAHESDAAGGAARPSVVGWFGRLWRAFEGAWRRCKYQRNAETSSFGGILFVFISIMLEGQANVGSKTGDKVQWTGKYRKKHKAKGKEQDLEGDQLLKSDRNIWIEMHNFWLYRSR